MSKRHFVLNCVLFLCSMAFSCSHAQQLEIKNASFSDWTNGTPDRWSVEVGATNGKDSPLSIVKQGDGPSLELSGDANTMAWQAVSQTFPIEAGKSYRFRFAAKTTGLKREGRQFENCYVGLLQKHERGQVLDRNFMPQQSADYLETSVVFRAHQSASEAQILIFLSKTGTFNIKDISIDQLAPEDSFQVLADEMDRYYSYFDHKNIDWNALTAKYKKQASAADRDDFVSIVSDMLAEIPDVHIWLEHQRTRTSKFVSSYDANFNFPFVGRDLQDQKKFGRAGITASTKDGFGYIRVTSLAGPTEDFKGLTDDIRNRLFEAPGIILDLRKNGGGSEIYAQQISSLFTGQETIYGRSKFRSGPGHDQFSEAPARKIVPAKIIYGRPVVCLIGPGSVSSAEAFAMMMKALPNVTLIGQPTRGASGNPQPVQLPNGVNVWFSRWMSLLPDGTPIEDDGVPPDETIEHDNGDPTYERALELLKKSEK